MPARVVRAILQLSICCVGFGLFMIGMRIPFAVFLIAAGLVWNRMRRVAGSAWSHGTARLASMNDLIRSKMLCHDGVILGTTGIISRPTFREGLSALWSARTSPELACHLFLSALGGKGWVADRVIRIRDFVHLATFAPTGRGKSLYVLLINLFTYRGSCLVTDPKGELFMATALHRMKRFKHLVFNIDPFEVCGLGTFNFNPLDCIDATADDFIDQCRDVANMMIIRSGTETDPHWNDSAELVLTAFIAFVCACETDPKLRNLGEVRALVSSRQSYLKAVEIMQEVESHHGVIKRLGEQLTWFADKELGSVMSTLQRQMAWLDSPVIARNMASSNFDPMALRTSRASVFLILPHDKLETLAPLMRIWIGVILRTITRGKPSEKNPVLFLLDEAAHLGKIRVLENAVTLMRGMGIRLWFFFQSVHQVQECYGEKAKTMLDNIDTQQYFGTHSYEAAEELSKRIGETTIAIRTYGDNSGRTYQRGEGGKDTSSVSTGSNTNYSDTGRRLYKAEEILTLPKNFALVIHGNVPVIPSLLIPFTEYPEYRARGIAGQPGLGRGVPEKAVCLLLASVVFAAIAVSLSDFNSGPERRQFLPNAGRWEPQSTQPSATGFDWYSPEVQAQVDRMFSDFEK